MQPGSKLLEDPSQLPRTEWRTTVVDSRMVEPSSLFVALPGNRVDGHDFIASAIDQGASGILGRTERLSALSKTAPPQVRFFGAADPYRSLVHLASRWRRGFRIPVIAVGGTVGKTSTKEFLGAIFSGRRVHRTYHSQNGYLGLPLTLLRLRAADEVSVIEIGIDTPGAMRHHLHLVEPTAGILTALGPEHLETMGDLDTVTREEGELLWDIQERGGMIALNADEPDLLKRFGPSLSLPGSRGWSYGLGQVAGPRWVRGWLRGTQLEIEVRTPQRHTQFTLQCPLRGEHHARNLLGAVTVGIAHGLPPSAIIQGLTQFKGAPGRAEILELEGPRGTLWVLADYYNALPTAMEASLRLFAELLRERPSHQSFLCLGDMVELGHHSEEYHQRLVPLIHLVEAIGPTEVLLLGPAMLMLQNTLQEEGSRVRHFPDIRSLSTYLLSQVQDQDAVLIKGARSMKLDQLWLALKDHASSSAPTP